MRTIVELAMALWCARPASFVRRRVMLLIHSCLQGQYAFTQARPEWSSRWV